MDHAVIRAGILKRKSGMIRAAQEKMYTLTISGIFSCGEGDKAPLQLNQSTHVERIPLNGCKIRLTNYTGASLDVEALTENDADLWYSAIVEVLQILTYRYFISNALAGVNANNEGWYLLADGRIGLFVLNADRSGWILQQMSEYDEDLLAKWTEESDLRAAAVQEIPVAHAVPIGQSKKEKVGKSPTAWMRRKHVGEASPPPGDQSGDVPPPEPEPAPVTVQQPERLVLHRRKGRGEEVPPAMISLLSALDAR